MTYSNTISFDFDLNYFNNEYIIKMVADYFSLNQLIYIFFSYVFNSVVCLRKKTSAAILLSDFFICFPHKCLWTDYWPF